MNVEWAPPRVRRNQPVARGCVYLPNETRFSDYTMFDNSRATLLSLMYSMGIEIPPGTTQTDAELEDRLKRALISAQVTHCPADATFNPDTFKKWTRAASEKDLSDSLYSSPRQTHGGETLSKPHMRTRSMI
jgi:hypothetical protein